LSAGIISQEDIVILRDSMACLDEDNFRPEILMGVQSEMEMALEALHAGNIEKIGQAFAEITYLMCANEEVMIVA
jgi:hypothetical protein